MSPGMGESLEQHDRIVGEALADSGGRVFKHTGDGMIAVFDDADAAVAGSLHAVDGLAAAFLGRDRSARDQGVGSCGPGVGA